MLIDANSNNLSGVVSVQMTILGTGSSGNCLYLETGKARLLIDAGFSARQIRQRMASIGRDPDGLDAIVVTHEHSDHAGGIRVLTSKTETPVYCNRFTKEALDYQTRKPLNYRVFETGGAFDVGDVTIQSFSVPHDASDPVGFIVYTPDGNLGYITDLGCATRLVLERLRAANVLIVETNHDTGMLQRDLRRPWSLKQRIMSRHGHLSNDAAAGILEQVMSDELRQVFLGHLSKDCNRPELALETVGEQLRRMGAEHVKLDVSTQVSVSETLNFSVEPNSIA